MGHLSPCAALVVDLDHSWLVHAPTRHDLLVYSPEDVDCDYEWCHGFSCSEASQGTGLQPGCDKHGMRCFSPNGYGALYDDDDDYDVDEEDDDASSA